MTIQWSLVFFTVLTGCSGWMAVCLAINEFQEKLSQTQFKGALAAVIIAVVGGIASVTHLSHPENIMGALSHPTSGIFVEALLCGLLIVSLAIFMVLVKRNASAVSRKALAIIAALFGVILSYAAGASYMMGAIENWNTFLLPISYLATSIPCGAAAYLAVTQDKTPKNLGPVLVIGGIIALVVVLAYGLINAGSAMAMIIISAVLSGVVPAVCGWLVSQGKSNSTLIWIVLICALIGSVCLRCAMWNVGFTTSNFFGFSF